MNWFSSLLYFMTITAVNVDSSTGTAEQQSDIEIKFNTSSMSYAERLLLKKHRRSDVDALFTPRDGQDNTGETPRSLSRQTPRGRSGKDFRRERSNMSLKIEEFNEGDFGRFRRAKKKSHVPVCSMLKSAIHLYLLCQRVLVNTSKNS